jgi:hypothetical protein
MELTRLGNHPSNPCRPVDWRWRRACDLVDNGSPFSPGHDDAPVLEAVCFLQAWRGCRHEEDRRQLARALPALYAAHELYLASSFQRWEVEARLLTEESFEQVAAKCGSDPQIIEAFHATFFNVRDRLDAEVYILSQAIGPRAHQGLSEADLDILLKLYGYAGGGQAVDTLVRYYHEPPVLPERPEVLSGAELEELRGKLLLKADILADTLPATAAGLKKLAVVAEAVRVIRRALPQGVGSSKAPQAGVPVSLDGLSQLAPWPAQPAAQAPSEALSRPPLAALLAPVPAA